MDAIFSSKNRALLILNDAAKASASDISLLYALMTVWVEFVLFICRGKRELIVEIQVTELEILYESHLLMTSLLIAFFCKR